jgi:hypothetical protein
MGDIEMPSASDPPEGEPAANEPILDRQGTPTPDIPERLELVEAVPELVLDDLIGGEDDEIPLEYELDEIIPELVVDDSLPGRVSGSKVVPRDLSTETEPLVLSERDVEESPGSPGETPRRPQLSKFRHLDQASGAPAGNATGTKGGAAENGSELGRIPLVRVRRGREGSRRVPYLGRLLSSF